MLYFGTQCRINNCIGCCNMKFYNNYFILRELPLLFLFCLYMLDSIFIYINIFWWSDPIQDVIVNSSRFTMSTSSFVYLFSTPHIHWLWRQRTASGFSFFIWISFYCHMEDSGLTHSTWSDRQNNTLYIFIYVCYCYLLPIIIQWL